MLILSGKVQRTRAVSAEGEHELVRHRAGCFHAYLRAPTATRNGRHKTLLASARQASAVLTRFRGLPVSVRYAQRERSRIRWAVCRARCVPLATIRSHPVRESARAARATPARLRGAPPSAPAPATPGTRAATAAHAQWRRPRVPLANIRPHPGSAATAPATPTRLWGAPP